MLSVAWIEFKKRECSSPRRLHPISANVNNSSCLGQLLDAVLIHCHHSTSLLCLQIELKVRHVGSCKERPSLRQAIQEPPDLCKYCTECCRYLRFRVRYRILLAGCGEVQTFIVGEERVFGCFVGRDPAILQLQQ